MDKCAERERERDRGVKTDRQRNIETDRNREGEPYFTLNK